MAELSLKCWMHPSFKLPFSVPPASLEFKVASTATAMQLMEITEARLEKLAKEAGSPTQIQIQVLWNTKDPKVAIGPQEIIEKKFENDATYGIYGDLMALQENASADLMPEIPEEEKLPVTILTGFLGSGKTTLLNYILQEQREKKIAIIENEFGEVSIDDALLKSTRMATAEKVIVMDNGCMCCTTRGDLEAALKDILSECLKGNKIDQIIIETTGMADPVPIVRTFMTNPRITQELRLDGIVAVADAKNIVARLDDQIEEGKVNEAYQQVAFCDKMLLNKLDLVSSEDAIAVKDRLRSINAFAKILPAIKSRVKISELVNMRAHDMKHFANADVEKEAEVVDTDGQGHEEGHDGHSSHGGGHDPDFKEDHGHGESQGHTGGHDGGHGSGHRGGHEEGHGHVAKKSRHDSRVNSFAIVREGEISPRKLSAWMTSLGQLPKERGVIFRIKGILAVKGHPYKHVFHAVMDTSDEDDAEPWGEGEKRVTKIVFIGKSLDRKFLTDGFEDIFEKQGS